MNFETLRQQASTALQTALQWLVSPQFYAQIGAIIVALAIAYFVAQKVRSRSGLFSSAPDDGPMLRLRQWLFTCRDLLFPVFTVLALAIAAELVQSAVGAAWLVRIAQGLAVVGVLYTAINRFITHPIINSLARWIGIPIAALYVFGVLGAVVGYLDSISLEVGNIRLSVYTMAKALLAAAILFWLGRASNDAGQKVIRKQEAFDIPTRELLAKAFQIALFLLIFVLLLQVLGLDLTALTVFGGALGVGLGFGMQQISSNFVSGIILLIERSMKVGDYVDLGGDRAGVLQEMNMRSSTLRTSDGRDILVPNEKFITSEFINWTKSDLHHRCEIKFAIGYDVDIHRVPAIVEAAVKQHPQVLNAPAPPTCRLLNFGGNVNFAVTYWVAGIDSYSSPIQFLIWDALKSAEIKIQPS
ncbi:MULTISPECIES: mechanosensitive ion channel domain-containing protein [unclassified Beijerinckia]|uniref:mechanosensitive ion channel family protein n=1 Tax=unclassified Beijerinckia TaxID=2638183 RepID=UPI00089AC92B|nr:MULTISPECIES: mechanosensitive ion channel domain-containing protein [unclassified Beijerinckia]MDH7796198.1 small-conductance mechanosensitive channel [Beijerinckia sp. GAS462]SEC34619.1 Mechanosensitive ion channel [Beijerinckia sp. 28-YEA-48]